MFVLRKMIDINLVEVTEDFNFFRLLSGFLFEKRKLTLKYR